MPSLSRIPDVSASLVALNSFFVATGSICIGLLMIMLISFDAKSRY